MCNGEYIPDVWGGHETVTGEEELMQRVLFKLLCRRGGFAPYPELGSRLYELLRMKPAERNSCARQFILEALENEPEVTLITAEVRQNGDRLCVDVGLEADGEFKNLIVML